MGPVNFDGAPYCVSFPTVGAALAVNLLAPCGGVLEGFQCYAGKDGATGRASFWNGERLIDLGVEAYGAGQGSAVLLRT